VNGVVGCQSQAWKPRLETVKKASGIGIEKAIAPRVQPHADNIIIIVGGVILTIVGGCESACQSDVSGIYPNAGSLGECDGTKSGVRMATDVGRCDLRAVHDTPS
jgi:hypothetical protein